ncbi:MAG: peptidase [Alphaproteobacteria bacterium]|nr:MAG: peptidase [Alphaproteobacteria bacterium]
MILLIIFLICVFITLVIGGLAGLSDIRSMTIPNSYSLYVMAAFFVAFGALYLGGQGDVFGSFLSHILSASLAFVVTLGLFAMRVIGAGDSKFATACALWFSVKLLLVFLFFMTLFGGVLGVVALYIKRNKPFKNPAEGSWVAQVQGGADKVPYGVAISFGMLVAFIQAGYFSSDVLGSFVASHMVEGGS